MMAYNPLCDDNVYYISGSQILVCTRSTQRPAETQFAGPAGLGWGLRMSYLASSQVMLISSGPHFENHCPTSKGFMKKN